jgi:histidine-containing phosphotransfer protein
MVELYFEDSAAKIEKLQALLANEVADFVALDQLVHQFKGSSASFGAHSMASTCVQLRDACHAHQAAVCSELVVQLNESFLVLKSRLHRFLELEARRKANLGTN